MKIYTVKVTTNGTKYWYLNDQLHCEHGPAIEWWDGTKEYYLNDQLHREDGPAIVYPNGNKSYYLHGVKYYSEAEWRKQPNKHKAPNAPKAPCNSKVVEVDGVKYKLVKMI